MGKNCFMIIDQQKDFNLEGAPYRVDCGLEALPYIKSLGSFQKSWYSCCSCFPVLQS